MEDDLGWVASLDIDDSNLYYLTQPTPKPTPTPTPTQSSNQSSTPYVFATPTTNATHYAPTYPDETQYIIPTQPTPRPSGFSHVPPGPVGVMLEAKRRALLGFGEGLVKPTQEYYREIIDAPEDDTCFETVPWLEANVFAFPEGGDSMMGRVPEILERGKINKVVGYVKECKRTDMGCMNVLLKDTTGSLPGTINHKVLDDVKGICVGTVLVLQNVSVFIPKQNRNRRSLNITKKNMVAIFFKDGTSVDCTKKKEEEMEEEEMEEEISLL